MLSVLYKLGDFGAFGVWVVSLVNTVEGNSGGFITLVMGLLGAAHLLLVRLYIPYKKNLRDAESHKLDIQAQRLVNKKYEMEIEDEFNEITRQHEENN